MQRLIHCRGSRNKCRKSLNFFGNESNPQKMIDSHLLSVCDNQVVRPLFRVHNAQHAAFTPFVQQINITNY